MDDARRLLEYQTPMPALRHTLVDYVRAVWSAAAVCFAILGVGMIVGVPAARTSNSEPQGLIIILIPAMGLAAVQFRYSLRYSRDSRQKALAQRVAGPVDNLDVLWENRRDKDEANGSALSATMMRTTNGSSRRGHFHRCSGASGRGRRGRRHYTPFQRGSGYGPVRRCVWRE